MEKKTPKLREWLDERGISATDAATLFGVAEQTISNWRSSGVPERRRLHVEAVMRAHEDGGIQSQMDAVIRIRPTIPQLQEWCRAADRDGKSLERWAVDGLDEIAAESEAWQDEIPLAAEDPHPVFAPRADAHGGTAGPDAPQAHAAGS